MLIVLPFETQLVDQLFERKNQLGSPNHPTLTVAKRLNSSYPTAPAHCIWSRCLAQPLPLKARPLLLLQVLNPRLWLFSE